MFSAPMRLSKSLLNKSEVQSTRSNVRSRALDFLRYRTVGASLRGRPESAALVRRDEAAALYLTSDGKAITQLDFFGRKPRTMLV